MKKQILLIFIFLFNILTYSEVYIAELINISANESLIIGKTSRLNFEMTLILDEDGVTQEDFCSFFKESGNDFIKITNLEIKNTKYLKKGNNIYFSDKNYNTTKKLELPISGTLVFVWSKSSYFVKNRIEELKLGYVNSEQNPIFLSLNISDLDPIHNIKVEVLDDMNLGTVFSGEKLSTKNLTSHGTPAKLAVEGESNKKIKLTIPENMIISNKKNESLNVRLSFRENNNNILEKVLTTNTGKLRNEQSIILDNILIDGECQSNKTSSGLYEGSFIVRVEYCLDN